MTTAQARAAKTAETNAKLLGALSLVLDVLISRNGSAPALKKAKNYCDKRIQAGLAAKPFPRLHE